MEQDFYFNELSLEKKPDSLSVARHLKDCYLKLKYNGFTVCRISHEAKQEILEYFTNITGISKHTITNFLYYFFASPFGKSNITETAEDVELVSSSTAPDLKTFSPRDYHRKDVLTDFWNKLKKNEHIVSGINSLPFYPKFRNFIKEIRPDGKIEIVLHWADKGLGLGIQTTGRNYREIKAIADILTQKYDM